MADFSIRVRVSGPLFEKGAEPLVRALEAGVKKLIEDGTDHLHDDVP